MRKTFAEVLASSGFSVEQEYESLYTLVYGDEDCRRCLWDLFDRYFLQVPFRGTCLTAEAFDKRHQFDFDEHRYDCDLSRFVSFCEYAYNIAMALSNRVGLDSSFTFFVAQHIRTVLNAMNYKAVMQGNLYKLIEDNAAANEAATLSSEATGKAILHYNHHSMTGDIIAKRQALLQIAEEIEPHREELKDASRTLCNQLFFSLNNLNIRHNNLDPNDTKHFFGKAKSMSDGELEDWYDTTYQMCLEAILAIERQSKQDDISNLMSASKSSREP